MGAETTAIAGASVTSRCTVEFRPARITVSEIARRLDIGRLAVYAMLEQQIIPGIRVGRRWIITWHAYEQWERTCGMRASTGLVQSPEVKVLN
jgi:excisionase family DNA binding protein